MSCVLYFVLVSFVAAVSGSSECLRYELPCEDGDCIDADLWCDSNEDCFDGSDEKYCKKAGLIVKNPNNCPAKYFKCNDGPCIPLVGRCNDNYDCADKSDEKGCEQETSTNSESTYPPLKSTPQETRTTTLTTTHQAPVKSNTHSKNFSESDDPMQHSVQIVYSDLRPSNYSRQREMARTWLLSQRRSDFGWGDETSRAITALYLSDVRRPVKRSDSDMLMMKQLEVRLSLDMARNGTKAMKLIDLALYINALLASCKDPKNFYGENLVDTLRNGANVAQREATFVNPSIYLTLCLNNATIYEDARKIQAIFTSTNAAIGRMDIQTLAMLTTMCIYRNGDFLTDAMYEGIKRLFIHKMTSSGLPGNVYEASLLAQATRELRTHSPGLLEFILEQQQEDGSFGGILATYLALPALAERSFLQINDHCGEKYITDPAPLEVLKNAKRRKIHVQYSLNYGYPVEVTQTIQMQVAEGINFLDVMRLAQEINPKFRFMLDENSEVPVVYSIGGVPNDAERGMFWTLHLASKGQDAGRFVPYSGNIKQLIPHAGDEYVFWMRSL